MSSSFPSPSKSVTAPPRIEEYLIRTNIMLAGTKKTKLVLMIIYTFLRGVPTVLCSKITINQLKYFFAKLQYTFKRSFHLSATRLSKTIAYRWVPIFFFYSQLMLFFFFLFFLNCSVHFVGDKLCCPLNFELWHEVSYSAFYILSLICQIA